ncbi:MAG TPA: type IV toxin-antitoxin system AbiEi family antitoxin domain-containing protein [Anaerolineales bacterium]|nr:type IV toxin-antitoxin system AbiEi family antitoxin domain-containing protein [Anaerolineales bacterium]
MKDKKKYNFYKDIFRKNQGILRSSSAIKLGIPKHVIYEMLNNGDLVRETRGLYRLSDFEPLGNPDLVQVSLLMPKSVIFLISALYIHRLTTQIPHQVYIALPQGVKERKIDYPPLRVFHLSKKVYLAGIEEHSLDGIKVKIYSREKTITDCFKYREKIGKEIAIEALKDYMRQPSPNIRHIMEYARINRVQELIRPYIETLQ